MKVQYIGESFGAICLTSNKIYECLGVEYGFFRVIDDSGEDYLYLAAAPGPLDGEVPPGKWKIIEDTEDGLLERTIKEGIPDFGEFKVRKD